MRLSLLQEMLDRASALGPASDVSAVLARAFERGLVLLERRLDGGNGLPSEVHDRVECRARFDFLRYRALALAERTAERERIVGELATESRGLHDRLWELHERTSRIKVALGLRNEVTMRPEPPLTIGAGGGTDRRRAGQRLLDGLERAEVELGLPAELEARLARLAQRHGWEADWGEDAPLVVVSHGLALLEYERSGVIGGPGEFAGEMAELAALGTLRFRIAELTEALRILQIRETAFRIDNRGMRLRLGQFEQEVVELEQEQAERASSEPPSRLRWFDRLFGGSKPDDQ